MRRAMVSWLLVLVSTGCVKSADNDSQSATTSDAPPPAPGVSQSPAPSPSAKEDPFAPDWLERSASLRSFADPPAPSCGHARVWSKSDTGELMTGYIVRFPTLSPEQLVAHFETVAKDAGFALEEDPNLHDLVADDPVSGAAAALVHDGIVVSIPVNELEPSTLVEGLEAPAEARLVFESAAAKARAWDLTVESYGDDGRLLSASFRGASTDVLSDAAKNAGWVSGDGAYRLPAGATWEARFAVRTDASASLVAWRRASTTIPACVEHPAWAQREGSTR
ncbi:MAG: hypothetical protein HOW73_06575 [Polyangiaceae bacterium]|nr:hypothetical protein [Polyangiaceae bacterium]